MSRLQVKYEWCYETIDEHEDIIESNFEDRLQDLSKPEERHELCLVRREGDEAGGEIDRLWAYVKDGKLPETFSDSMGTLIAITIPKNTERNLKNL